MLIFLLLKTFGLFLCAFCDPKIEIENLKKLQFSVNGPKTHDAIQSRFGFLKSVISDQQPSVFLPPQHFTSFLRPEELTGDEMKTFMYAESNKPNTVTEYPDRLPDSVPQQQFTSNSASNVFQLLKGQLSKSIPSIKAYLLTKDLPFPKLNQLPFPLKLELPQNVGGGQSLPIKPNKYQQQQQHHQSSIWSYLKGKSLPLHSDLNDPQSSTSAVIDSPKPTVYFVPKGIPIESPLIKDEPITLYLNKYNIPETTESIKLSPESEHNDQPVYKEAIGLPAKPTDTLDAIQSQYNEQYAKQQQQHANFNQIQNVPNVNINEFPSNQPSQGTSLNDFYASPYLQNPHIVVTRPFTPTWVPNAKKWYPGTHKSAFYPDTRIIKFTIQDRIYNNSTKKPNYVIKTQIITTTKPPINVN